MKKFVVKASLFCIILFALCIFVLYLSAKEPTRALLAELTKSEEYLVPNEMLPYFEQARKQDHTNRLIIGDSICRQMFTGLGEYNPETKILATNAALMITGQYLMAEEYLKSHPETTEVFLVMHPMTITRTIDTEWSYRYAAMTYVETNTLQYLDENTVEAMTDTFGSFFMNKKVVQAAEVSPIIRKVCLNYINANRQNYVQSSPFEIADQYVKKLHELCKEKDIAFYFYSSPVAEFYREDVEALAESYENTWMSTQYPDYLRNIYYYPDDWTEDMSHFSGSYAERGKLNEIMEQAYGQTELLESVRLQ